MPRQPNRFSSGLSRGKSRWTILALAAVALLPVAITIWGFYWPGQPDKTPEVPPTFKPSTSPYKNAQRGVAYVGDETCARCHSKIHDNFRTHPMGHSATTAAEAGPGDTGTVLKVDRFAYSIERKDGKVFHVETKHTPSGESAGKEAREVLYAIGSGTRGLSFLVAKGDKLYQSPLSWYTEGKRWDLAPSYRIVNEHFNREIALGCLFCHTNQVESTKGKPPVFHGLAIGCERCHGPGELHDGTAPRINDIDLTIVNPKKLDPELRESVCQQCHLLGTDRIPRPGTSDFDFRPGLPFSDYFLVFNNLSDPASRNRAVGHVEQMKSSECFRKSDGRLGCISCHDPHKLPEPRKRLHSQPHAPRGAHKHRPHFLDRSRDSSIRQEMNTTEIVRNSVSSVPS